MSGPGNQDEYPPMAELLARRNAVRDKWTPEVERQRAGRLKRPLELPTFYRRNVNDFPLYEEGINEF